MQTRIKELESKCDSLDSDISSRDESIEGLRCKISELKSRCTTLEEDVSSRDNTISDLNLQISTLQGGISESSGSLDSLRKEKASIVESLQIAKRQISDLQEQVAVANSECNKAKSAVELANTRISNKDQQVVDLNAEISRLNAELTETEQKLADKSNRCIQLQSDIDSITVKMEGMSAESSSGSAEVTRLQGTITQLETRLKARDSLLASKDGELESVSSRLKKIDSENSILRESVERGRAFEAQASEAQATIEVLERSSSDKDAKIAELLQELEQKEEELTRVSTASTNVTEISALKTQVLELQGKLEQAQLDADNSVSSYKTRLELAQAEVSKLRQDLSASEATLAVRNEELGSMQSSIFTAMASTTLPKSVMNLQLDLPLRPYKNLYVFASGSAESSASLYKTIRKQVSARKNSSYLILDIVTDTCIDRELGITPPKSPIDWLQGNAPVDNFIATSKSFPNARVISTALGYMNELFFLTVDWGAKFEELSKMADVVIINIGSLGGIVQNILYNSFTNMMRGFVLVKATPINLRTVFLHLTQFQSLSHTMVLCTDYSESTSKKLYDRLSAKYTTKILGENDSMSL